MEMTGRALGASIATGVFALITAAPLQAQVQRYYESNTDFYARRSLEQSQMQNMIADNMASLRMSQMIEQSRLCEGRRGAHCCGERHDAVIIQSGRSGQI